MEHLLAFISDCDRRTEAAKQRLAETQEELSAEVAVKANSVHELAEQIGQKLAKAEQLGGRRVDELRKKKLEAEQEYRNSMPASSYQQQKLRVCEVCSAYLGIHDNDRRLADHFGGKLHLGFIKIREKLAELEKNSEKRKEEKRKSGKDRDRDDREDRYERRYREHYVGGRELDRRSKRHRSRSKDRKDKERERDRETRGSRSYKSRYCTILVVGMYLYFFLINVCIPDLGAVTVNVVLTHVIQVQVTKGRNAINSLKKVVDYILQP
ncbi:hypothetical protein NQ317_017447 [Molorchus minor]|uniref:Uncharacterized protein n=1 Tax=Molorchus minor TaxID=1323400 RepID=A0ABQ9JFF8_9CUCU|nr:hypothetical protein NQ317_017447 [Molorchus minor]